MNLKDNMKTERRVPGYNARYMPSNILTYSSFQREKIVHSPCSFCFVLFSCKCFFLPKIITLFLSCPFTRCLLLIFFVCVFWGLFGSITDFKKASELHLFFFLFSFLTKNTSKRFQQTSLQEKQITSRN